MKAKSWILSSALCGVCLVSGCDDGGKHGGAESDGGEDGGGVPPIATPAAPAKTAAVSVPKLTAELVAKMTFAKYEEIEKLLQQGARPDAKNRYGLPVIFTAAKRGDVGIVDALIQAGADVNSKVATSYNDDGEGYSGTTDGTPMTYAAGAGMIEVMKSLHKAGADVNGAGPGGTTALIQAAESEQLAAIEWLLKNGATAGREKALAVSLTFVNPNEKRLKIQALLGGGSGATDR